MFIVVHAYLANI